MRGLETSRRRRNSRRRRERQKHPRRSSRTHTARKQIWKRLFPTSDRGFEAEVQEAPTGCFFLPGGNYPKEPKGTPLSPGALAARSEAGTCPLTGTGEQAGRKPRLRAHTQSPLGSSALRASPRYFWLLDKSVHTVPSETPSGLTASISFRIFHCS